jgi:hypothetical protein
MFEDKKHQGTSVNYDTQSFNTLESVSCNTNCWTKLSECDDFIGPKRSKVIKIFQSYLTFSNIFNFSF